MRKDIGPQTIEAILIKKINKKPPAHQWQDFALRIIAELGVPNFKRGSVFKACKDNPKEVVEKAMNETKELCQTGEKWKYFFKVLSNPKKPPDNKVL
ncbi:MAG TPA: hypothetical protein VJB67_01320 [Patescibacteria group bacterium]|nr:hypothetical protein [Patescibacteria group bacterium]